MLIVENRDFFQKDNKKITSYPTIQNNTQHFYVFLLVCIGLCIYVHCVVIDNCMFCSSTVNWSQNKT